MPHTEQDPSAPPASAADCCAHCPGELYTLHDIKTVFAVQTSTARALVADPGFPAPIVISRRCHRWPAAEVLAFRDRLRRTDDEAR